MAIELRERMLAALDAAQRCWLALLDALGLAHSVEGQPAWPHGWRFSAQVLAYDASLVRDLLWTLAAITAALLCAIWAALAWRRATLARHRPGEQPRRFATCLPLALAAIALLAAPWPARHLVFTPAVPTSFHRSPTGFDAQGIVAGQRLYAAHCASCHGATGRGDGPQANRHGTWPPTLIGNLLAKRLEGELLWRVRHGWGEDGADPAHRTPHAFGDRLSTAQAWQVLDFLAANAAGQNVAEGGGWPQPVRLPRWSPAPGRCANATVLRTRLVFDDGTRPPPALLPDPRLRTVQVLPGAAAASAAPGSAAIDCSVVDPAFAAAMALLLGVSESALPGHQVLADRDGWLRARSTPGAAGWREDDLLCSATPEDTGGTSPPAGEGLNALIARMDAAPLSPLRAGFKHR
jgi:mono/diheme cytochrome c family protein